MTRKADKTAALAISVPDGGAIIVAHNSARRAHIEDAILEQRGADVLRRCKIRVCTERGSLAGVMGTKLPVLIDHAFLAHSRPDVVAEVEVFAKMSNRVWGENRPSNEIKTIELGEAYWTAEIDLTKSRT